MARAHTAHASVLLPNLHVAATADAAEEGSYTSGGLPYRMRDRMAHSCDCVNWWLLKAVRHRGTVACGPQGNLCEWHQADFCHSQWEFSRPARWNLGRQQRHA